MNTPALQLYSYWRSSAAYRVRIGLNLKQLAYEIVPVHLVHDGGEQHGDAYKKVNPQELVPALSHDGRLFRQSMAILEYVEETWPAPSLLPSRPEERARVRAMAQLIACDVHPLQNLRVLQYLHRDLNASLAVRDEWVVHWIESGFAALEQLLDDPASGRFSHGDQPGLADCCLVPQVYNARRFGVDLNRYPRIAAIEAACLQLPAFLQAQPEAQLDAPSFTSDSAG